MRCYEIEYVNSVTVACEQALVWVLCVRCERRAAKLRGHGARWARLGGERETCFDHREFLFLLWKPLNFTGSENILQ